jgi:diguanylate cyclase (GGDEF)-like protein
VFGQNDINFVCNHAEPHDDRPYMCFPVLAHGETVGLMHLRAKHGITQDQFTEGRKLAQLCAEQISLAIANVRMRDELQDQSVRDPLTGLYNRRHLTETLRRLLGRHAKTGEHLAVVSVDIDHFKRFNDNHGHDAGDMVLRAVGAVLTQHVDGDEIACRIGGEELMLLLPGADTALARTRAEALREAVQAVSVRYGDKTLPAITISIGVAVSPVHGTLPQDLMRAADDALYLAKARGRNQVIIAGSTPAEEPSNVHKTIDERAFDRRGALELPSVAAE